MLAALDVASLLTSVFRWKKLTDAGIDMIVEFADRTFNRKLVATGSQRLNYPYDSRSQLYNEPLEIIPVNGH